MKLYKVKKCIDTRIPYFEIRGRDLVSLIAQIGTEIPLHDLMSDTDYFVRVATDGKIEVGYLSDEWQLK